MLIDRLSVLAGRTTFRIPAGGRGGDTIPTEHMIAGALGMSRTGPDDIAPDLAFDIATGKDRHRGRVLTALNKALTSRESMAYRVIRRNSGAIAIVLANAYDLSVNGPTRTRDRPDDVTPADWAELHKIAHSIIDALVSDVVGKIRRSGGA